MVARTTAPPSRAVTLVSGDGIGPEVVGAACRVLAAAGSRVTWERHDLGVAAGTDVLPESTLESIRRTRVALKGPVSLPPGSPSVNVALKQQLDLFLQVRPSRSLPGVRGLHADVDLVVMRETTEDFYAGAAFAAGSADADELLRWLSGKGRPLPPGSAVNIKATSEPGARRMLEASFGYARRHGRRRVTVVHKTAVLRCTDGLFRAVARDVAAGYPDLEFDELAVDLAAARIAQRPSELDVLVMPGQYGDILSDVAAAVTGGIGIAPGATYGQEIAIFEAVHGTAPHLAGQDRANPVAVILSGALLLRHIGQHEAASRVELAVADLTRDGRFLTYDLASRHPAVGTEAAAEELLRLLR